MQILTNDYISSNDRWQNSVPAGADALQQSESMSLDNSRMINDLSNTNGSKGAAQTENSNEKDEKTKLAEKDNNDSKKVQVDNTILSFERHDKTGEIMVKIVDKDTGEVIREIPPEKILDCIAQIWKNSGINVDKKV